MEWLSTTGTFPANVTLNGIVSHEDWFPTFAAVAGAPGIKEKLLTGTEINGRKYRNHVDGYNQLDYLSGKAKESPRNEFWYVNDDGQIVAARYQDWKVVFLENRGEAFGVWREPFVELRAPLLFNLGSFAESVGTNPLKTEFASANDGIFERKHQGWKSLSV